MGCRSDARYATNAALAETEATTIDLSKEVQQNANQLHNVATDAATTAQVSCARTCLGLGTRKC